MVYKKYKNNKIIFLSNPSYYMPTGLNITVTGDNNLIIIEEPNFVNTARRI